MRRAHGFCESQGELPRALPGILERCYSCCRQKPAICKPSFVVAQASCIAGHELILSAYFIQSAAMHHQLFTDFSAQILFIRSQLQDCSTESVLCPSAADQFALQAVIHKVYLCDFALSKDGVALPGKRSCKISSQCF